MAMSYLTESEAPRDFRVSSTESDGHYTKCILCYTVKKNFYCAECVKNGNFVHSSVPYSDRYSEKQVKLMRMKINRQYVLERCEMLLAPKMKKDMLVTETKQSRDKLDLIRLAIEQRRSIIDLRKKELLELKAYNSELKSKMPRYQKRVSSLGKHAQAQRLELQTKICLYNDQAQSLAALRRSRIRQLTRYIFPIYMSYDSSDSIEDMEFVGSDIEEDPPKRPQLHIVAPWIDIDADYSHIQAWAVSQSKEATSTSSTSAAAQRARAALGLSAQLVALLAWTLDVRLPHAITLSEYSDPRSWRSCVCRARAGAASLSARASLPPPPPPPLAPLAPLAALHSIALAAAADDPELGTVEPGPSVWAASAAWQDTSAPDDLDDHEPPEHLTWPEDGQMEEVSVSPPVAPSLVTSAAASLASIASVWRGWTK
ncbi:beclin 1-associated autophagy-related key regulator like protein [Danaus plexippus plexippus]|uniref:Beclin 1-associated autophagy-related key regulator like protein n=1 Tax=Danaus plexippus plexippus TaxID=278856 RepID=A0A212F7X6_DANPL|nr:beclin 1-associated autophagy-related key regulator [Danaus plexippus plexippus]OWR49842.1 beclin 1-associated autophagy-related key regulator like protein [Danaus plexippus plexippus]